VELVVSESQRASIPRPPIYRITLVQLAVLVPSVVVLWLVQPTLARSVLAGALLEMLARAWFGFCAFRYTGARQMHMTLRAFRYGEVGKFLLIFLGSALLFQRHDIFYPWAVALGFIAVWIVGVVVTAKLVK
jgi:F0F1-type ATP synthase assembly protein I